MTAAAAAAAAAVTGEDLVAEARAWVGTPWQHAQRLRGVAVDCVQLAAAALIGAGLIAEADAPKQYSTQPNTAELCAHLDRWFAELPAGEPLAAGDLLLFDVAGSLQHVGLYAPPRAGWREGSVIHAYQTAGRVCEHDYERHWRRRTAARFRWKGWAGGPGGGVGAGVRPAGGAALAAREVAGG